LLPTSERNYFPQVQSCTLDETQVEWETWLFRSRRTRSSTILYLYRY